MPNSSRIDIYNGPQILGIVGSNVPHLGSEHNIIKQRIKARIRSLLQVLSPEIILVTVDVRLTEWICSVLIEKNLPYITVATRVSAEWINSPRAHKLKYYLNKALINVEAKPFVDTLSVLKCLQPSEHDLIETWLHGPVTHSKQYFYRNLQVAANVSHLALIPIKQHLFTMPHTCMSLLRHVEKERAIKSLILPLDCRPMCVSLECDQDLYRIATREAANRRAVRETKWRQTLRGQINTRTGTIPLRYSPFVGKYIEPIEDIYTVVEGDEDDDLPF